jgi:Xaa-Pro aminopeptidase
MGCLLYDPERIASLMDEAGLDALIATTAPNVQYLTRFQRGGGALAVLVRSDLAHPDLIVKASSISFCLEDPCEAVRIYVVGRFYRSFTEGVELTEREMFIRRLHDETRQEATGWDLVAERLQAAGLQNGTVGTDGTVDTLASLQKSLPNLRVKSTPGLFSRLRMVKSPEEVRRLAEAARITEHAILTSVQSASLGVTQQSLARVFNLTAITANSFIRQDNVSIDRGSAFGNLNTPGDVVKDGSIIRYDVGVHYRGYASDMARCFAFRTKSEKAQRIQAALVEGEERLLELVRPGITAAEIFQATVEAVRKAGLPQYERTHVGHGIGIAGAGYDLPLLGPADDTVLEPGMVLCVETPYVEVGFGALQVEDMLVVTPDGYRLLTHTSRQLEVVP